MCVGGAVPADPARLALGAQRGPPFECNDLLGFF